MGGLTSTGKWVIGILLTIISALASAAVYQSIDFHDKDEQAHLPAIKVNHNDDPNSHLVARRELLNEVRAASKAGAKEAIREAQ